jgi:hypothetical protein
MNPSMASAVLVFSACAAQAGDLDAYGGIAADAATTAAALALPGIAEANPLGWVTVPLRIVMVEHAKTLPREQGQPLLDATQASGWGAAANNILAAMGAGGAAPLVGLAIGYAIWKSGEKEREFWRLCGVHRSMAPAMRCTFRPWANEEVVRLALDQRSAALH